MTDTSNKLNKMLEKAGKIAAKKQLFYSLSQVISNQMTTMNKLNDGKKNMEEMEAPEEILESIRIEQVLHLSIVYQIAISIRAYRAAFGENPEFVRFLQRQMPKTFSLEKWEDNTIECFQKCSKLLGKKGGKTLINIGAFGEDFHKDCEAIKIKGEE